MNKLLISMVLPISCVLCPAVSHAAILDLTTFGLTHVSGTDSSGFTQANLARISGASLLSSAVSGLQSFDWKFINNPELGGGYGYLITTDNSGPVITNLTEPTAQASTDWATYTFAAPFSGVVKFAVYSADDTHSSALELRNVVTSVPEPETYAMLLAGLGVLGFIGRRRAGTPAVAARLAA